MSSVPGAKLHFLTLPYDIRHLVYEHLFPPDGQLFIQALRDDYRSITPDHHIPTAILRSCRQLHAETSGYLYNTYLFNIFGRKPECLASYDRFQHTVRKYARHEVHAYAFSNGDHSATMGISLHAGTGKMEMVQRRERGVPIKFDQVRREIAGNSESRPVCSGLYGEVQRFCSTHSRRLFAVVVALVVAVWAHWTWRPRG